MTPHDLPMATVSDDMLISRLYELAQDGDHETAELRLLDVVVYGRLAETYGEMQPELQDRQAA
ncbi:MAG TPA: hypothetical protein VGD21_11280 [Lysobacter sp.]